MGKLLESLLRSNFRCGRMLYSRALDMAGQVRMSAACCAAP